MLTDVLYTSVVKTSHFHFHFHHFYFHFHLSRSGSELNFGSGSNKEVEVTKLPEVRSGSQIILEVLTTLLITKVFEYRVTTECAD
jgi:hypothetical protein